MAETAPATKHIQPKNQIGSACRPRPASARLWHEGALPKCPWKIHATAPVLN
ncbi:MAG: hypothetical protein LBU76_09305 [Azoarcus sp.]|nr:hypothetical protein [Azoarcus sp.]